jgi:mono/diheme cytochrome c family protein
MAYLWRGERIYDELGKCLAIAARDFTGKSTRWDKSDFVFVEADPEDPADRAAIGKQISALRDQSLKVDAVSLDWVV